MEPTAFDTLTRATATSGTRRRLLTLLAALPLVGILAVVGAEESAAQQRPIDRLQGRTPQRNRKQRNNNQNNNNNNNNKKKKNKNNTQNTGGTRPGACTPNGSTCTQSSACCGGNCFNFVCAERVTQCSAAGPVIACTPPAAGGTGCCASDFDCCFGTENQCDQFGVCCAPDCAGKQCGPDGCGGSGTCGSCPSGTTCNEATGQCAQACDVCATCRYPTVQAAVADSGGPTTIRICPGTFTETITIGRALTLIGAGQGSGAGDTILQGNGASVVTINPGVGPVTLQTLRITGGSSGPGGGGGVHHQGTALTMTDCTVTGNTAQVQGGGILTEPNTTSLTMTGCTISANQVNVGGPGGSGDADGGGLFTGANATLTDCTISGNTAVGILGNGGGIFLFQGTLTLNHTSVTGNSVNGQHSDGGGIYNLAGTLSLQNGSSVTGNTPDNCVGLNPVPGCSG